MKLLHVADLYVRPHWFEWVAAQASNYDAVCVAGDLLDMFGIAKTALRAQATWTRDWLGESPGRLFVCSGTLNRSAKCRAAALGARLGRGSDLNAFEEEEHEVALLLGGERGPEFAESGKRAADLFRVE
jgi:hypothetical protein